MEERSLTREWRLPHPVGVGRLLLGRRRGAGDPTYRVEGVGERARHWRGLVTPDGPATLVLHQEPDGTVHGEAWGPGARWALDSVPGLLGQYDDPSGFAPDHPVLAEAARTAGEVRFGRSGLVMEALVPAVIEQRVTGQEAFAGFRRLVQRYGDRAPGPHERLFVQPTAERLRRIPSWEWLRLPVDPARSRAVLTAARVADSIERTVGLSGDEVERRLTTLPGIGVWTAAEVRQRAHGDPDAVSFGDYHVAKDVGWAIEGRPWDDEELAAFLEPFRPHRNRVVGLVYLARLRRPRRGPRMAPRTHLPR
ncbi:DNA-3-methyladenine glycosylase 2 family protein [Nocardioides sp. CER19]|uniref:DNA-3-methyladenine glycosylase family protein n=1 Tax=Nocardioides sp. CER19 TaxID=3038538 RepID=UPI00244871F0|nr:DNA-3-methyladenine glycosylase 2 family protein [Nocardioides sp. CER19]MDH2416537.1 DNA-3-methyladenine glycosylase 2 family protein [Nocardioides sp. CER19]